MVKSKGNRSKKYIMTKLNRKTKWQNKIGKLNRKNGMIKFNMAK